MNKAILLILGVSLLFSHCRHKPARQVDIKECVGKYEANGIIVQFTIVNDKLTLIVPGAPLQELTPQEVNRYESPGLEDQLFEFIENDGKVTGVKISSSGSTPIRLDKMADTADDFNKHDAGLTLKKTADHFVFLYSEADSGKIDRITEHLEQYYKKLLADFRLDPLPVVTVRVFPDLASFHEAVSFPHAPKEVMATAFGKDDLRMVSPAANEVDSLVLMKGIAHEFAHIVHLNVDYSPNNPRWLWEGLAMYESDWRFDPTQLPEITQRKFPPFGALAGWLEMVLGYVIIEAIADTYGFDAVIDLVKSRGDVKQVLKIDQERFEEIIYNKIYDKYVLKK
jgi:hypothetical protein